MTTKLKPPLDLGQSREITTVKVMLSLVPVVGSALAEIAGHIDSHLDRRQEIWMPSVPE